MAKGSSLFSEKLDRATFSAYFLGAVVPLIALAVVVERFALPTLADRNESLALIALVICATVLSLGSFLVLRRVTRRTLDRVDRDNHRLTSLLHVASKLASVQHVTEATDRAATCALVNRCGPLCRVPGRTDINSPPASALRRVVSANRPAS